MKACMSILLLCFLFISCKEDDPTPVVEDIDLQIGMKSKVAMSEFISSAHPTSGSFQIFVGNDTTTFVLENFKTDSAPALNVWLSTDLQRTKYVDLGRLKSNQGTFSYSFKEFDDPGQYKYALIWCVDFAVLFGYAEFEINE